MHQEKSFLLVPLALIENPKETRRHRIIYQLPFFAGQIPKIISSPQTINPTEAHLKPLGLKNITSSVGSHVCTVFTPTFHSQLNLQTI